MGALEEIRPSPPRGDSRVVKLLAFALLGIGLATVPAAQQTVEAELQPNILVIVLDDVGTDKLRIYGESDSAVYASAPFCGVQANPIDYPPTPNLEAIAAGEVPGLRGGGIRFERAYGAPICGPARACLQSGRYGFRTGLGVVDDGGLLRKSMPNEEVLLPELLRKGFAAPVSPGSPRKYATGAFGKWHLSALPVCDPVVASEFTHPVANGFQLFQGTMTNIGVAGSNPGDHYNWTKVTAVPGITELTRYQVGSQILVQPFQFSPSCSVPGTLLQATEFTEETFTASVTRRDAVQWINDQTQPFFAYVAFQAPHFPYQVPPFELLSPATQAALSDPANCGGPYCAGQRAGTASPCGTSTCGNLSGCTSIQQRLFYNALLEAVDTEIGRLLAEMSPRKRANTMVFVISDNGTPAAAIEGLLHDPDHGKGAVYELSVRVPVLAAGRLIPEGQHQSHALVHVVDLWSTLASLSGADESLAAPLQPLDSVSFANVLRDPSAASARTEVFTQTFVQPGPYAPTEWGPYEPSCADPFVPGVYFWSPRNVGSHARSLSDGHYKLLVVQSSPGAEVAPPGQPDVAPTYTEELYNLWQDPEETSDLLQMMPGNKMVEAIRSQLRTRMTQLSGF